jgi:uncharacterized protein with PIN domain
MKAIFDAGTHFANCRYCRTIFTYEDEDIEEEVNKSNLREHAKEIIAFYTCPVCGARYELRHIITWKEEEEVIKNEIYN